MGHVKYFKDLFDSIQDYRNIVLLMFLIKNEVALLHERGFSKINIVRLCKEFNKILNEQIEEYLDYIRNEEESFIEKKS